MRWNHIDTGDKIRVTHVYPRGETIFTEGIVKHIPQDTGDAWYIQDASQMISAINPTCAWLVGIERIAIKEEKTELTQ